jgi:hypothetical protein
MLAYSQSVNSGGRVEICQIGPRLSYNRIYTYIAQMPLPHHSFLSNNIPYNMPGADPSGRVVENVSLAVARLLGLRVRIPPGAWMSVCCQCCVLSDGPLCNGPITRPEESYRVCVCVCVCVCVIYILCP